METTREKLIDELFAQAVELPPAEREKFLAESRPDDEVIDEVKALLTNYRQAQSKEFLNQPFVSDRPQTLRDGQQFEGYTIVKLIAEGGMGEVYLAEDEQLKRKVAIKLIKGHATKDIMRRFQNERQILAHLQHSNIAQLYEAGASADGLPFFVMEYIEGKPIDKFIRDEDLSLNDRLKLFRTVCSAVSYAHQNLIIHRDLKPGNVFVNTSGEVKLLDFGIAKLLQNEATLEDVTATMFRALTPQYASPEQIKGEPISTASDVYSLGVLLYELLTGQRPYKLKKNTAAEITNAICEQEPMKPSSVRTNTGTEVRGNGQRNGSVAKVSDSPRLPVSPSALRGDVDNIILKALRKEPSRRYGSVEQFSEDIRRYLEGLPVSAHKGSFTYRAGKFVKRNKIAVAAVTLIVLTLAGGIIATTFEARRANRRFNEARQLAHTILFDYHDQIAALPGSTQVRERLVKDALKYLDNLSKEAGDDVSLLRELADGYERVAAVQGGTAMSARHGIIVSASNLGDTSGALANFHKALLIREKLVSSAPNNNELRLDLAYNYISIAFIHVLNGPPDQAVEYLHKGVPILETRYATDSTNEDLQYKLWNAELALAKSLGNPAVPNLGDWTGAMALMQKWGFLIERLASDHPDNHGYQQGLAAQYNAFGQMFIGAGKQQEALESYEKAAAIDQALVTAEAANMLYERELAVQLGNVGNTKLELNDRKGAVETLKQALAIYESMLGRDPNDAANRRNTAVGYRNLAVAIGPDSRAEALKDFNKALDMFSALVARDSDNNDFRRQWAYTYLTLSRFQLKADDLNAAVESAQQGIKIDEALVGSSPTNASARNTLALLYRQLGDSYAALGANRNKQQWSAAKDSYQKALDIYQDMKSKGALSGADANKPAELEKDIAKCDAALKN